MTNESSLIDQNNCILNEECSETVVVVIPAYNEETSVERVVKETSDHVDVIIVCDDGSSDKTGQVLEKIKVEHISNIEKIGKGASIRALFNEAKKYDPEIIITMDADYQHDPNDIPKFIREIRDNGANLVLGSRFVEGSETDISWLRLVGLTFINNLQRILLKCDVKDTQCGFRAFSRDAFFIVTDGTEDGYNTESEQLFKAVKAGLKVSEIPVKIRYKGLVTSKKNFILHGFQLVFYIINYFLKDQFGFQKNKDAF